MVGPLASRDTYERVTADKNPVLPSIETAINGSDQYASALEEISRAVVDQDDGRVLDTGNRRLLDAEGQMVTGRYVGVDPDALYSLAEQLAEQYEAGKVERPAWDEDFIPVFLDREEASVRDRFDFMGYANTTNAKFWRVQEDENGVRTTEAYVNPYKPPFMGEDDEPIPWDGAMGQWAGFKKLWEAEIQDSDTSFTDWFMDATRSDVEQYWGDIPMKTSRLELWRDTAETLEDRYGDGPFGASFATIAEDADGALYDVGEGMVDMMARLNGYQDYRVQDGQVVWLDKQVQLAGNMMYLHFLEDDGIDITGADQLEVFANYRLPQMMHNEGELTYSDELAAAIDESEEIPSGSRVEWELRMLTVVGGHLLQNTTNHLLSGDHITIPELDNLLYQAGSDLPRDSSYMVETEDGDTEFERGFPADDAEGTFVRGHPKVDTLDF